MTPEEREANSPIGPGGYKCRCCGPHPRLRKQWRRKIRARLKAIHDKIVDRHDWSKHEETYHE